MKSRNALRSLVVLFALGANTQAAVVTYNMDLSVPGEFKLFASADTGDNYGLALYGLPFTAETSAMITSYEQVSPFANWAIGSDLSEGSAGFSQFRSKQSTSGGALMLGAGQDTITGTSHLIRGLGQTAGSFAELGLTAASSNSQTSWGDSLLLARGTYTGDANNFRIATNNSDLIANVFVDSVGSRVKQAQVHVTGTNGYYWEPSLAPPSVSLPPVIQPPIIPPPVNTPPIGIPPEVQPPATLPPVMTPPVSDPITIGGQNPSGVPRPVVTYNMDLSVPGQFKLYASASTGDNFGIASYGLPLAAETVAKITSLEHVSPSVNLATNSALESGSAGFTLLRGAQASGSGEILLGASQDTIGATPHLIRGFGQTAGSFSQLGLTPVGAAEQSSWDGSLLIAQGSYSGQANDFLINTASADMFANVFSDAAGAKVISAEVHVNGTNGFSFEPQPVIPSAPPISTPSIGDGPRQPELPVPGPPPTDPSIVQPAPPFAREPIGGIFVIDPSVDPDDAMPVGPPIIVDPDAEFPALGWLRWPSITIDGQGFLIVTGLATGLKTVELNLPPESDTLPVIHSGWTDYFATDGISAVPLGLDSRNVLVNAAMVSGLREGVVLFREGTAFLAYDGASTANVSAPEPTGTALAFLASLGFLGIRIRRTSSG